MPELTLLFSSAGRRVELIQCFRHWAKHLGISLQVVAIDMDPEWSPACRIADRFFRVPRCTNPDYVSIVVSICRKFQVNLIIPTIDPELLVYARNRSLFAEVGTEVLASSEKFIEVARDKATTAKILRTHGIPAPLTWFSSQIPKRLAELEFPLLLKPRGGSCSKGIKVIRSVDQLDPDILKKEDHILQQMCSGREYTVNCFYDRSGACVACVPHYRKFVRDGEVCFAQTERITAFTDIAQKLSNIFAGIWGCICFQGFVGEDGAVNVFEINARFGGGYPICDHAGGTFAKWVLQDLAGEQPDHNDNWREGVRMLRYDAAIFI